MLDVAPPVTRQCLCANLIPATLLLAYPVLLCPTRHLSAAVIAVSPEEGGGTNTLSFTYPQRKKNHTALDLGIWAAKTVMAHLLTQHGQSSDGVDDC